MDSIIGNPDFNRNFMNGGFLQTSINKLYFPVELNGRFSRRIPTNLSVFPLKARNCYCALYRAVPVLLVITKQLCNLSRMLFVLAREARRGLS